MSLEMSSQIATEVPVVPPLGTAGEMVAVCVPLHVRLDPVAIARTVAAAANSASPSVGRVEMLFDRLEASTAAPRDVLNDALKAAAEAFDDRPALGWARSRVAGGHDVLALVAHRLTCTTADLLDTADLLTNGESTMHEAHVDRSGAPPPAPIAQQRAFWETELAEHTVAPPHIEIRTAPERSGDIETLIVTVPAAVRERIEPLAAAAGSPGLVVAAAYAALLGRYSDPGDVALFVRVKSQPRATGEYCGWESNTLRVRISLADDPTFTTVTRRVRAALATALPYAGVSIDRLTAEPAHVPVFAFDLRPDATSAGADGTIAWASVPVRDDLANRVSLHYADAGADARLRFRFASDAFARSTIERLAQQLVCFLECATRTPDEPMSRARLMTEAQRAERIAAASGARRPYERDSTVDAQWTAQVVRSPNAVAVADQNGSRTYAQVEARANTLANHLIAAGVRPGCAVGVTFERSIELPVTLLAILKAGAVYVPLDLQYPAERLALMIEDAGIEFLTCTRDGAEAKLPFRGPRIVVDAPEIDGCSQDPPAPSTGADSVAYIMYTSGSTGRPKGVSITHRGILRLVRNVDYVDIAPRDGYLQHAPLAFDASTFEIWAPLLNGARLGIPRPGLLAMGDLAAAIESFDVTTLFLTTSLFGRLVDSALPEFARLRQLLTGGEVASAAHMKRFLNMYPDCRLIAVYGPTENTTFSTWLSLPTPEAIGTNVPIGKPIANSTAYVVDAHGEIAPIGMVGELWVGGDGVATSYVRRPELTNERFGSDPFGGDPTARIYKTGDRARWRDDDVLEFLGRTDGQLKVRGFRVEVGEIESALQTHPAVRAAAVIAVPLGGAPALAAFVECRPGAVASEADVRAHVQSKLPAYMIPQHIRLVPALPEHASGKVDRVALAAQIAQPIRAASPIPPRRAPRPSSPQREIQQIIIDAWRTTLAAETEPDLDTNFFDAGGDSLRLLTLHAMLAARLGSDIRIMDLFEHTTIRKLATFVNLNRAQAGGKN